MLDNRPDNMARVFIELELKSQWATCQRGRVASALMDRNWVIQVPSYNGTPRHQVHCGEFADPNVRCQFCIHSEKNCINHAARYGVSTKDKLLATLKRPCLGCSNDIIESGIVAVYYRWDYDTDNQKEYVERMFENSSVRLTKVHMTTLEESFSKMIEDWRFTWTSGLPNLSME